MLERPEANKSDSNLGSGRVTWFDILMHIYTSMIPYKLMIKKNSQNILFIGSIRKIR